MMRGESKNNLTTALRHKFTPKKANPNPPKFYS